jgi:hypothetical protein
VTWLYPLAWAGAGARRIALALAFCFVSSLLVSAQPPSIGVVEGAVTTQSRTVPLTGAVVVLRRDDQQVGTQLAATDGHFRFDHLRDGHYQVAASLDGFTTTTVPAVVSGQNTASVSLDLPITNMSEHVDVVAPVTVVPATGTLSGTDTVNGKEIDQMTSGGGFQSALRLLASVIEVPGGVSIKGGRPSQASVQIGPTTLVDPSTGLTHVSLPDDAIDSVAVLPNPYAVEFGRFSSGLVVIRTRRAGDEWHTRLNNLDPAFRTSRSGNPFDVKGVSYFSPRLETGGPIIKNRLFVEQTAQFRYSNTDVPSRPENELKTDRWFSAFTRVDANLSPKHSLMATGGIFPRVSTDTNLGTFTPVLATVNEHSKVNQAAITERALWTDSLFSETTVQMHRYTNEVTPRDGQPMALYPETTLGNFYNRQSRNTDTYQVIESVSGSRTGWGGLHLYKFGVDLLHSDYNGTSASEPVLIYRPMESGGALVRRLDFGPASTQAVSSTDVALFLQDRIQPTTRWYAEVGGRIDRDGIIQRFNATPRIGTAVLLNEAGSSVIRGGYGLFYERTPSTVGAFGGFENAVDTRYADDGVTLLESPRLFRHTVAPDLRTPLSRTWDIAYDYRLNTHWAFHAGVIDRAGSNELIVLPVTTPSSGQWLLESAGHSIYRSGEASVHFTSTHGIDVTLSYARSAARGDLNSLATYFDVLMWPIIGQNEYAPTSADVPHRLLARGRAMPTDRWLLIGIFDWRSGLPYSVVDERLDFVGARNQLRFPAYARTELGVEHRFKIFHYQPWIGVRAYNAFNKFLPTDVQANLASPAFGTFYNSEYRQFRIQVRFER